MSFIKTERFVNGGHNEDYGKANDGVNRKSERYLYRLRPNVRGGDWCSMGFRQYAFHY